MSIFPLFPLMLAVTPTAAGEELAFTTFRARGFTVPVTGLWFAAGQARSAVPLGGLGTGYLDLNSDGSFGRATLHNNWLAPQPPPPGTFFALFTALEGKRQTRLLQTTGGWGQPGIPGLRYWGHVPMVDLEYEAAPAELSLRAFGPLVPGDYETSALPAAMFSFRACNPTDAPLTVSLLFSFAPQREGPLVSQGNVAGLLRWARAELGPGECWEVPVVQVYGESEEALRHNLAAARREATALAAPATLGQGQTLHGPQLAEVFLDATGGFNWEANRREGAVFRGHPTVGQVFFAVHYRSDASRQAQLDFAPGRECVPVNWSPTQPTRLAADGRSAVTELTTTEGALRLTLVTAVGDSPAVLRRFTLRNLTNRPLTEVRLSVFVNFDLGGPGQEGDDRADFWPEEGAFHVTDDSTGLHAALAGTVLPEAVFVGTWHTAREALKAGRAVPLTALEEPIPAPEVFPLPHGRGLALPAGSRGEGYAIAAVGEGWEVTHLPAWNPAGKGQELWGSFAATGRLALTPDRPSSLSPPAAGALAARTLLPAQAERTVTFVLTWYFPRWLSSDGHELEHLYAARFPSARAVAEHVGPRQGDIAAAIVRWQTGIYASNLPGWLQDALLNGLYSLIRNTWWLSDGRFFHSESFTGCPITETLVCRFNGSFPLLMLWP
ncbi:MAG TPA: hypothetical protein EYP85_12475, partial [Armatimonadetes bacterium]|nr:hypothetical protein [Armatimonadota bacterium]